jgi:CheY-like chemotaxis protein
MIQRLIGEHIQFTASFAPELAHVKVDRTQMDQVLLNLVVNARDAMPIAGKLTVETANVTLDDAYVATQADARSGPHVMLAVTDNGCGMNRDTLDRIFEPFFTTKGLGKGTGLGLATVYGIVKQSGGHLTVYSEPNFGTTFKIYLPAVDEPATPDTTHITDHGHLTPGRGTILLAEDEEAVRAYAERVLFDAGYRVVTAADGKEALQIAETIIDQVDLLLTDVVMPRMGGRQLAEALREKKPTLKILYMSGYTDDAVLRHGVLAAESAFLQKPFSAAVLTKKVQSVLVHGK